MEVYQLFGLLNVELGITLRLSIMKSIWLVQSWYVRAVTGENLWDWN